jgi:hypothetical protein
MVGRPVYKQAVANDYRDIEGVSNELGNDGFHVDAVVPALSGRYVVLGRKDGDK